MCLLKDYRQAPWNPISRIVCNVTTPTVCLAGGSIPEKSLDGMGIYSNRGLLIRTPSKSFWFPNRPPQHQRHCPRAPMPTSALAKATNILALLRLGGLDRKRSILPFLPRSLRFALLFILLLNYRALPFVWHRKFFIFRAFEWFTLPPFFPTQWGLSVL